MVVKIILGTLFGVIFLIGVLSSACICAAISSKAVYHFISWRHNKCKIRWLCKHTYIDDYTWRSYGYTEVHLVCRKCGKEMRIDVYDDYDEDEDV